MSRKPLNVGDPPLERAGWPERLKYVYLQADPRWLGVLRLVLGILLCGELLRRWGVARDFYTNDGVLSNHFSLFRPLGRNVLSLYHAFSTPGQVNVAFGLTLVVFLVFLVGYRTRLFHLLSFLCITSLDARNLMVENGGTVALNLLCFWTLFLPLGKRLSVDAVLASLRATREKADSELNAPLSRPTQRVQSLACFALLFQWSAIYFFNAVHKSGKGWRDGSAIHWFLHQDRIVTWLGIWVREHVPFGLLQGMTYGTLVVEGLLAFLLLSPFRPRFCRLLALALAVALHGGIAAMSRLGVFSYVMVGFFVWPLSAADWRWVQARLAPSPQPLRVIYDDDCGICLWACRVLRRLAPEGRFRFIGSSHYLGTSSQGESVPALPESFDARQLESSVAVLTEHGEALTYEAALLQILRALPLAALGWGWLLALPGPRHLLGAAYRALAPRRHAVSARLGLGRCGVSSPSSGGSEAGAMKQEQVSWEGSVGSEILVACAFVVAVIQLSTDNVWARSRLQRLGITPKQPVAGQVLVDTFRLYQGWRMFAPEPPYEDGKLVVDARTKDGRTIDPLTGEYPDFNPYTETGWGHDQFWCDFHLKMYFSQYSAYRGELRRYLQSYHERTGDPDDRLVAFDVWWVNDKSPPPGELKGEPQPPVKVLSQGRVKDSLAEPWLERAEGAKPEASSGGKGPKGGAGARPPGAHP